MAKIIYYTISKEENPVKIFIDSLQIKQKAKIFRIFQYIQAYGLSSVLPHIKRLTGTPLWEIRILGRNNIRILYIAFNKDTILLLNGFVKKTPKTPPKEIDIALRRLADFNNAQNSY